MGLNGTSLHDLTDKRKCTQNSFAVKQQARRPSWVGRAYVPADIEHYLENRADSQQMCTE